MALKFNLVRPADGATRSGYFGFAWSTLLAGPLTAVARRDFGSCLLLMSCEVLLCALVFFVDGNPLLFVARLGVVTVSWAILYNELYTLGLFASGFQFDEASATVSAMEAKFPPGGRADRIQLLRERSLVFVVIGLGCLQALVQFAPQVFGPIGPASAPNQAVQSQKPPSPSSTPTPSTLATPVLPAPTPSAAPVSRAPSPSATLVSPAPSPSATPASPAPVPLTAPALPTPAPSAAPILQAPAVPKAAEKASQPAKPNEAVLADRRRECDAAMGTQLDSDLPSGAKYVADTSGLSEADIDRAIASCEPAARAGSGRRYNSQLGRAYAARAVLLATRGNEDPSSTMNQAVKLWETAAAQGSGAAMNFLGAFYKGTFNTRNFTFKSTPDYPKALQYWLDGDKAGNLKASRNAGGMLLLGPADFPGIDRNVEQSKKLLEKAVDGGDTTAASLYGQALYYGSPPEVGKNPARGVELMKQACKEGDSSARAFFDAEYARAKKSPFLPATRPPGCP